MSRLEATKSAVALQEQWEILDITGSVKNSSRYFAADDKRRVDGLPTAQKIGGLHNIGRRTMPIVLYYHVGTWEQ